MDEKIMKELDDLIDKNKFEDNLADLPVTLAVDVSPRRAAAEDTRSFEEKTLGDKDEDDEGSSARMELYDWLQSIVLAFICGILIFVFVGRTIGVDGSSMMQTLHNNDRVIMSNLFYTPSNGDIIVFHSMSDAFGGTPFVKRIIAIAGQTIDIDFEKGEVFVDGVLIHEPYINTLTEKEHDFIGPMTIPEGYVFVMGDNRNRSSDSRDNRVGLVDTRYILGKVLFVAVPGGDETNNRDWGRIGVVR